MKAMILAAGRGERMRPLTDHTPKPLLQVADKPMIEYTIEALVANGYNELVINIAHLGKQIETVIGTGKRFNASILYSHEGSIGLETAGGIMHALPLLGNEPFLVVNGDIASDFPFYRLKDLPIDLAHLILVANPEHHQSGDFGINNGILAVNADIRYTFSGIGVYRPELFAHCQPGKQRLAPLLRQHMKKQKITGELYSGFWMDIGTRERLMELDQHYQQARKQ